ncbi:MAG: amidase [Candidatus Hodarchaeales archaeon]|jgi:Asp-tRNA(Asn)/Glu-tRNA(Gln) amidotransferase A subunit family amidase
MSQENHNLTEEALFHAEKFAGLEFTHKERDMMLPNLWKFVTNYRQLRDVTLISNHDPPLYFNPQLPGQSYGPKQTPIIFTQVDNVEIPSNIEDIAYYSIIELSWLLKNHKIPSIDLTKMYIDRLRRFDPILKCVINFNEELALKQATQMDEELSTGKYRGVLHGIPYGIKDAFAFPKLPTTWGATPYKDQIINKTATVIKRLENAGAVMIAKLSMGELGGDHIWFGGETKSPWNLEEGAGGSSAGSAAATAAGLVGFSVGTETWGSIVQPSDRCGVTGLRPTYGRVSRHGVMALSWTMDKVGPICRTVEDCAIVFNTILGLDGNDQSLVDFSFNWRPNLNPTNFKIGYTKDLFEKQYETRENDQHVMKILRSIGIDLIPTKLPKISISALYTIILAEAATVFDDLTLSNRDDMLIHGKGWANDFRAARMIPAVEYLKANRMRRLIMQQMSEIFSHIDVVITPTIDHSGDFWQTESNFLSNLTGHPAVVIPTGFKQKQLPSSITLIGGLYKEAEILRVAKAFQDLTNFHLRRPGKF